ncbi:MAG TPA: gluconate 2-dehydrogenase subunit 3 family protein [Gemmatimonadaceae bacterium]|nr:gluconate 2-dehydrogenase subunit 3 family protein [Gemmatimonadaceae bacterium]
MDRRRALELLGSLAILPALSPSELFDAGVRAHDRLAAKPRALTDAQFATVVAAAEQIIPRTQTPGATDANVAQFVDVMLADWYSVPERERFVAGVDALDRRARQLHQAPFARCTADDQRALLRDADAEVAALNGTAASQHWFATLKFLTVWGYCTSRLVAESEERLTGRYDGNAPYRAANPS